MLTTNDMTYSDALNRLQQIVSELELGAISIDELEAILSESQELIQFCGEKLRKLDATLTQNQS